MAGQNNCGSVKWPGQQVGIKPARSEAIIAISGYDYKFLEQHVVHGAQSIGYDANFDTTDIFQLGCGSIYEQNEGLPQVSITLNRVLDGYCPAYSMASTDAPNPTLFGRSPCKSDIAISYFDCTQDKACGAAKCTVVFPDTQVSSMGYTFGTDGAFTEDVSFVGNNVIWVYNDADPTQFCGNAYSQDLQNRLLAIDFSGYCCTDADNIPKPAISFKEHFIWEIPAGVTISGVDKNGAPLYSDVSVLPTAIQGISCSGLNVNESVCVQDISFSADLNREEVFCLGRRGPATRTITPPIDVTTTINVISECGPNISVLEDGAYDNPAFVGVSGCQNVGQNLIDGTIRVATCQGLRIYLGTKNKLTGYSVSGASTGGENLTVTYNFLTKNDFTVLHKCENGTSGFANFWSARDTHLLDP